MLERGPPRQARGHLETGVATALTYGLRIERGIEAARAAMEIGERLGDEVLWAGAAEAYGWHTIVAGGWPRASTRSSAPSRSPTAAGGRSWRAWRRTSAGS